MPSLSTAEKLELKEENLTFSSKQLPKDWNPKKKTQPLVPNAR
jgi:hypothetical protein